MYSRQKLYNEIISEIDIWGIEKEYINLGDFPGPQLPDWVKGETLYQIYLRAFTAQGTFAAAKQKLEYLQELGIRLIWLTPVCPIGKIDRKGTLGSPYAIHDYFSVNPEFGTEQDFKEFISEAHKRGIRVILDMVLNHVAPDYNFPKYLKRDEHGKTVRKIDDWTDVVDLDYSQDATRTHVLEILKYWVQKFNIDGYRCDVAGLVPLDFWEWVIPKVNMLKEDLFWLAEWESPHYQKEAFHSYYDWSLYTTMDLVLSGKRSPKVLLDWLHLKKDMYPQNSLPLRFLENHDLKRAATVFGVEKLELFLTFIFTVDGLPLIYNGQEFGEQSYSSLFEKEPYPWPTDNPCIYDIITQLILLRRNNPALSSGNYQHIKTNNEDVLIYKKDDHLLAALNFSATDSEVDFKPDRKLKLIFNSADKLNYKKNLLRLMPWQSALFEI